MQAHKLNLPLHHHRPLSSSTSASPVVSSLLVEPSSRSLALMLSDSSFLLYPSLALPPPSSFPPPTMVPRISTSACFLLLQPRPDPALTRVLFLSASSHGSSVLLRAWILSDAGGGNSGERFMPSRLSYKQERSKTGLNLGLRHGFSVRLVASVNVFILHSPAAGQIWVCAARLLGETGEKELAVEVMKCAAIECTSPIFSLQVAHRFLLIGEVGGVRVFPLVQLIKGKMDRRKDSQRRKREDRKQNTNGVPLNCQCRKLPNGLVAGEASTGNAVASHACKARPVSTLCLCNSSENEYGLAATDPYSGKSDTERVRAKRRTVKLKQSSGDFNSYFVAIDSPTRASLLSLPVKAISVHALSHKKFLILDSVGDLHVLRLCNPILASETTVTASDASTIRLNYTMKVQMLAVLHDSSLRTQIAWVSDALNSIHIIPLTDIVGDDKEYNEKKVAQVSAVQAVFTSEKIQDVAPLSANAVVVLGQGAIFVYSTP